MLSTIFINEAVQCFWLKLINVNSFSLSLGIYSTLMPLKYYDRTQLFHQSTSVCKSDNKNYCMCCWCHRLLILLMMMTNAFFTWCSGLSTCEKLPGHFKYNFLKGQHLTPLIAGAWNGLWTNSAKSSPSLSTATEGSLG